MHASVSESPPTETAFRMASSKSVDSRTADDGLRDCALAVGIPVIRLVEILPTGVKVIIVSAFDIFLDLGFGMAVPCHPDGNGGLLAPLMPSGWLCVISADIFATFSVSSRVSNNHPTALTLMPAPLPKLPYG